MNKQIAGRDGYIVRKALAYAVAFVDSLPEEQQEISDRHDMVDLLVAWVPDPVRLAQLAEGIRSHTGILPDLTPEAEETLT